MPIMLQSNHALFFDGVSDSVIIPQGSFSRLGRDYDSSNKSSSDIIATSSQGNSGKGAISDVFGKGLAIEAWVVPDCGGVILSKDGQFRLSIGSVDTPGPVEFEVNIQAPATGKMKVFARTALPETNNFNGHVYPVTTFGGLDDSYNRFDGSKDKATSLSLNQRPLYHIVAALNNNAAEIYVNGALMSQQRIPKGSEILENDSHVYIGGKGGEFRGVIEGIHVSSSFNPEMTTRNPALLTEKSISLFRFEEPISTFDSVYTINSIDSTYSDTAVTENDLTAITISTTEAQSLANLLTGKTVTDYVDFTVSPYSTGNYSVVDRFTTPGTTNKRSIPHVPYNLLINPGSINQDTKKPNGKPPERVRLHRINISTGEILVSSIHLDFPNSTNGDGLRPILHSTHTSANGANSFVVIAADYLIENGTGRPYQPPHLSTQIIDRTGQMLIDEGNYEQHALAYSSRMATTTNSPNNPFKVTWPADIDELFQVGHSGRHTLNHVEGHHYLRTMPRANNEALDQQAGNSDILTVMYDETAKGIDKLFPVNSKIDYYREVAHFEIVDAVNSSIVHEVVTNGLTGANKKLIAIGGTKANSVSFNPLPFVLKGPVPIDINNVDADLNKFHLHPSSKSRVALLSVPTLASRGIAPYVEVHYNAIDFSGASMSKTTPMIMIEKTVPASNLQIGGAYIVDDIATDVAAGNATLFAPGGYIDVGKTKEGNLGQVAFSHSLIGDNSEGFEADVELDERLTPQNFTATANLGNTTPQNISSSQTTKAEHDSVFHKLFLERNEIESDVSKVVEFSRQTPTTVHGSPSAGQFDVGITSSASSTHEMFDIIDNLQIGHLQGVTHRFFIQPSDRRRTNQLQHVFSLQDRINDANHAIILFLMSTARLRGIEQIENDNGRFTTISAVGLTDVAATRSVNELASGSPDSHVVKEIDPNAPVVSVTLGGVGQGGFDTKPSFDRSTLANLPYSSRRGFSCLATKLRVDRNPTNNFQFIEVAPLNNTSPDLKSWGTYPFPKEGRIYLKNGASAKYSSKTGSCFIFTDSTLATRNFIIPSGGVVATFQEWVASSGLSANAATLTGTAADVFPIGEILMGDGNFFIENLQTDGSTVNDRMFQSADNISHDYQLGTQFASTRALVEIPLFRGQFFADKLNGIYPAPDNSLKLHIDPTMTAHTWNPSPVGRRFQDIPASDRTAFSAYAKNALTNNKTNQTSITHFGLFGTNYRITVANTKVFPASITTSIALFQQPDKVMAYRRAFLPSGEWCIYDNDPETDGYLQFPNTTAFFSENFITEMNESIGLPLLIGNSLESEVLVPLKGDTLNKVSEIENRSEYYHDAASVKTQGGNIDYGLRQYVSAVEFKAGPMTNPHAAKTKTGRAEGTIVNVEPIMSGSTYSGYARLIMSDEDADLFPNIDPADLGESFKEWRMGEAHYTLEIIVGATTHIFTYMGHGNDLKITGNAILDDAISSIIVRTKEIGGTAPAYLPNLIGNSALLSRYGFNQHFDTDKENVLLNQSNNLSNTARPTHYSYPWSIVSITGSNQLLRVTCPKTELLQSNTLNMSIQDGDYVYAETIGVNALGSTPTSSIYLGQVSKIEEGMIQNNPNAAASIECIISLAAAVPAAQLTLLNDAISNGAISVVLRVGCHDIMKNDDTACLNKSWNYPFAQGGLRHGDTIWMNMTYNNPHAVQGLFCKSRGVFNEALVYKSFNGGKGDTANLPRDSIPLENFLIGDTCLETANNFVQHVNKTIQLNYNNLGMTHAPTIAYLDPYLAKEGHARVLLYDVSHDREFIAFQDIHMQVQSSAKALEIGYERYTATSNFADGTDEIDLGNYSVVYNGGAQNPFITQIDVANGFPSQNKYIRSNQRSNFMESAYAHNIANNIANEMLQPEVGKVSSLVHLGRGNTTLNQRGSGYSNANGVATTSLTGQGTGLTVNITTVQGEVVSAVVVNSGTRYINTTNAFESKVRITGGNNDCVMAVSTTNASLISTISSIEQSVVYGKAHGHFVQTGYYTGGLSSSERSIGDSIISRTNRGVVLSYFAEKTHIKTRELYSSDKFIVKELMQRKTGDLERQLGTVVAGGSGYNNGTFYNVITTTNGNGRGMTVNVAISGGVVQTVVINRVGDGNYKNGDAIFVGDRTLDSPNAASNVSGNGLANAILNVGHKHHETSTLFDTPDGTRVIPAFLALKGIRSAPLDLTNHPEANTRGINLLPQWSQMDFVRRLTIDLGEVSIIEGITNIEAAANEVVRMINQAGATGGKTHAPRNNKQYPVKVVGDADFAVTGSTFDPTVWWDEEKAFASHDKGTHMGYLRAHLGRVVKDIDGNEGFSIVIHSTVPGATGRNFAVWLDNSKGQAPYKPEFLIGHGGRFRTFWCLPDELTGENMHPAPMPLNKHGRPFAPITSLRQFTPLEQNTDVTSSTGDFTSNLSNTAEPKLRAISAATGGGQTHNTVNAESFEAEGFTASLVEGLRTGTSAVGRINFGGLVEAGVPGFAPDAGKWGFGRKGDTRFMNDYGIVTKVGQTDAPSTYTGHVPNRDVFPENIGDTPIYGLKLQDHVGSSHGIRYIYKNMGEKFTLENTKIPQTLDNEIVVHFNHKDCSQGGFTIGRHMHGIGDPTGRFPDARNTSFANWQGNLWRGASAPNAGYLTDIVYNKSTSTLTVTTYGPYDGHDHPDILGYMGFPATNGVIHVSDPFNCTGSATTTGNNGTGYTNGTYQTTATDSAGNTLTVDILVSGGVVQSGNTAIVSFGDGNYANGEVFTISGGNNNATFTLGNAVKGSWGNMFNYTHRSRLPGTSSTHTFHGVTADTFISNHSVTLHSDSATNRVGLGTFVVGEATQATRAIITSVANWTTLVTDELMAAVTAFAINLDDPNIEEGVFFDCTDMYASDGKTFGEWGITPESIKVKAFNTKNNITPISNFFTASVSRDMGIKAAHLEFGEIPRINADPTFGLIKVSGTNNAPTTSLLEEGRGIECGYIPKTILQINSRGKGTNTNTATPILVDSDNIAIDTTTWSKNLNGQNFTASSGDLILPNCDNPTLKMTSIHPTGTNINVDTQNEMWHFTRPPTAEKGLQILAAAPSAFNLAPVNDTQYVFSFGQITKVAYGSETGVLTPRNNNLTLTTVQFFDSPDMNAMSEDWPTSAPGGTLIIQKYADKRAYLFAGKRSLGSVHSIPIIHFSGGRDSPDKYVPLYFGGGFTGATIDINDGTNNDYAEHNTHHYANGPTGSAGIQNANEILSSFSTLDCNAIMAFFPATALLNQNRGSINPPVYNKNNILSPDLKRGGHTPSNIFPDAAPYTAGVHMQAPSPMVLRFAHPTARYQDHKNNIDNKTTFIVFGPGQAFPLTRDSASPANQFEPHPGAALTVGNTWSKIPAKTNDGNFLPNHIANFNGDFLPEQSSFQTTHREFHYKTTLNWESSLGIPLAGVTVRHRPENGRNYGSQFSPKAFENYTAAGSMDVSAAQIYAIAQPNRHAILVPSGMTKNADLCWHMDNGNHPGGSWMDNQITMNPPMQTGDARVAKTAATIINPTAFRVAGVLANKMLYSNGNSGSPAFQAETLDADDVDHEYIVVDATRCQNGEELACVLGAAINTFPGKGALKAIGGTFMPSMGNSSRQDRYGWIEAESTAIPAGAGNSPDFASIYGNGTVGGATADADVTNLGYSNRTATTSPATRSSTTTITFTGTVTSGSATITGVTVPATMKIGQSITGTGLAAYTIVTGFDSGANTVTVSPSGTSTPGSPVTLTLTINTLGNLLSSSTVKFADCFIDLRITAHQSVSAKVMASRIPSSGWLRSEAKHNYSYELSSTSSLKTPAWACYTSRAFYTHNSDLYVRFYLGINKLTGSKLFEDGDVWQQYARNLSEIDSVGNGQYDGLTTPHPAPNAGDTIWIWSKSSTHYVDNSTNFIGSRFTNYGIGAVHFNGLVDAIDRTKPIGAVGWHGERYSYLNTLNVGTGYAAGLGAWHTELGFSPYGSSSSCATVLSHLPNTTPLPNSPESAPPIDYKNDRIDTIPSPGNLEGENNSAGDDPHGYGDYTKNNVENSKFHSPPIMRTMPELQKELINPQGIYARSLLVVAHEGELSLVARKDRDGYTTTGDYLVRGGTTEWDERFHDADRFIAPANAGPNVEALIADNTTPPSTDVSNEITVSAYTLHGAITADTSLSNAEPCLNEIGDLFTDLDNSIGTALNENDIGRRNISPDYFTTSQGAIIAESGAISNKFWIGDVNGYDVMSRSPHKNFSTEHVVWKRMDGGSLTLPTSNARGLGAVPWVTRVTADGDGNKTVAHLTGEKLLGNIRFSFESTNTAMMPVLQAQEIAHPQLAAGNSVTIANVLNIPNEELQFEDMSVIDDTGQLHVIQGGSPLGVIIRAYKPASERLSTGLSPSFTNSGIEPNLEIQLPNPDDIPGNLLVRSGFDPVQAYQHETMGDGGMLPMSSNNLKQLFVNENKAPRLAPTMNEVGWEHISQDKNFPESSRDGWNAATNNNPIETSYELHDRALYFHITKMGHSHTEKFPTTYTHASGVQSQTLSFVSLVGATLTVDATITQSIFAAGFGTQEVLDEGSGKRRRFLRIANTAGKSVVASYTGISGATFTGVVGDIDTTQFLVDNASATLTITPSYYVPAGSTRIFAARRLRDHAEVSGSSPDMAHTMYFDGDSQTTIHSRYSKPQLTPMPLPRMGHHYVNATMPMMPGHWAHPSYQGLYTRANSNKTVTSQEEEFRLLTEELALTDGNSNNTPTIDSIVNQLFPLNPYLMVGSLTANPSGPSDIHGGAFTLMFETKIKYDGYGVLASKGTAGDINKAGGHSIVLEAGGNYTQANHFPDPAEVGAYQIIIQPNLSEKQFTGFHRNNTTTTALPNASDMDLTSQQVNLVIGIKYDEERHASLTNAANIGGVTLILAEATLADVRGCEIFINEVILDHDPDHGSQFTNIPPMLLYNPLGVQGSESPHFTRRGHPYHPPTTNINFKDATPGHTTNIPWWSIMHKDTPNAATSVGFRHLAIYRIDNYYQFCRASYGSVAAQITLAGYPSISPDIYSTIMENISLTPSCTIVGNQTGTSIQVDDASLFPEIPYYGQKLIIHDNPTEGETLVVDYSSRQGVTQAPSTMNEPDILTLSSSATVKNGQKITLSKPYSTKPMSELFTIDSESIITKNLGQTLAGTRDTNSLTSGDAYLCAWSPNLGRPHTFYSDASRTWITNGVNHTADRAINKAAYNSMPKHFETIHYHDVNYAASHGPFALMMKSPQPPIKLDGVTMSFTSSSSGSNFVMNSNQSLGAGLIGKTVYANGQVIGKITAYAADTPSAGQSRISTPHVIFGGDVAGLTAFVDGDGTALTASQIHALTGYSAQGSNSTMYTNFWPCGSRGGPLVSRLDGYATTTAAWHIPQNYGHDTGKHWIDDDDDGSYSVANGIIAGNLISTRTYPFGYRFGLRQPWNRPQWGHYGMRAFQELSNHGSATQITTGYRAGPVVHYESQGSNTWVYEGGNASQSNTTLQTIYAGILERQTTAAGMLNADKYEWQVRYSEGRRMTRGFGCAVRTIRNPNTVIRDWWGDSAGKNLKNFGAAVKYYLVDWWGNTRGEDIRRFPVRSFGINPSWDAGDAYEYDRTYGRTPYDRIWNNGKPIFNLKGVANLSTGAVLSSPTSTIPRFGGRKNTGNNNTDTTLVDVFAPTNAMRVGDMGGGRGVRFPTQFNEDVLVELDAVYENSGVVLSSSTAEPTFGKGYLRPRDDVLQPTEIVRGISRRLEIDEDGLLKPEATVSDRVEDISGNSVHKDAVSRSSPRIGIEGQTMQSLTGSNTNMVAINSEAHSLHTNRGVGQRVILHGGMQSGSQTLGHYDLTTLSFAAQPHGGVMRFSHTANFKPMGGTYVLESRSFASPFDDTGWGRSGMAVDGSEKTSNPYQITNSVSAQTNKTDDSVKFLVRPIRLLDNQHIAVFRPQLALHSSSKQTGSTAYTATAGGKYGMFSYETTSSRASSGLYMRATDPNTNAPYQPVYLVEDSSDTVPTSKGPKLLGTEVTGYDKTTLKSNVTRLVISENSLQHFRSDAPRRDGVDKDYTVKARFSQALHSKGHKGDVDYSKNTHTGDS